MEPVAALSLACNILQVVEFSTKVLSKSKQLRTSFAGILPENIELEKVVIHQRDLVQRLQKQTSTAAAAPQGQGYGSGTDLVSLAKLCIETSNELLDALELLKVRGSRTKWKTFRHAVKSLWKKEKIDEVLKRLQVIRDEIEFGIIMDLRDNLYTLASNQSAEFRQLDQSTKAILQAVTNGQSASTAATNAQLQAIRDLSTGLESLVINEHQQTRDDIIGEIRLQTAQFSHLQYSVPGNIPYPNPEEPKNVDILVTLKFQSIDNRYEAIPEAHRKTFEWIWADQSTANNKWSNFWQWLTSERGIYWVSGKAGSGKSTLMKYMYHDHRKSQGLEYWAGPNNQVVTAGFFFWNSGTHMQKSLMGLLQSILYEILRMRPDLKDTVFPKDIQKEVSARWVARKKDVDSIWSVADLKTAFARLVEIPALKICLFIDGLDEFEGDHREVAELFMKIIKSPSVKACLSSRPLLIFEQAFSTCPRLRLQDLTYDDIVLYVRGQLEGREDVVKMSVSDPAEFHQLVDEIIEKASGVFLWVTLVLRSLIEGITNFDRIVDLRIRLKEIPDDLSQLYWHILQRIKPAFYLAQAAKLLGIAWVARTLNIPLTIDRLAAAENYEPGKPLEDVNGTGTLDERNDRIKGRLNSRCRGLLEVRDYTVVFLHQSVADFLSQPDVVASLQKNISGQFNPYASMLAALLTEIGYEEDIATLHAAEGVARIDMLATLAGKIEEGTGAADVSLMEMLDEVISNRMDYELNQPAPHNPRYWCWKDGALHWAGIHARRNRERPPFWNDTFTSLCAQWALPKYVEYRLENGESLYQGPYRRPLLSFLIEVRTVRLNTVLNSNDQSLVPSFVETLQVLFKRGANPNETFGGVSMWNCLLCYATEDCDDYDSRQNAEHEYLRIDPIHGAWVDMMKLFLRYGAEATKADANFVHNRLMSQSRRKGQELYNMLLGTNNPGVPYGLYVKPRFNPPLCEALPEPQPEDIPHLGKYSHFPLRLKGIVTPDSEGLIPVYADLPLPISPPVIPPVQQPQTSGYQFVQTPAPIIAELDSTPVPHPIPDYQQTQYAPNTQIPAQLPAYDQTATAPIVPLEQQAQPIYQSIPTPVMQQPVQAHNNYQPAPTPVIHQPAPSYGPHQSPGLYEPQQPAPSPLHYQPSPSPSYQQTMQTSHQHTPSQTPQNQMTPPTYHQRTPSQIYQQPATPTPQPHVPSPQYQQPVPQQPYLQPTPPQTYQPAYTQTFQQPTIPAYQYTSTNTPTQYSTPPSSQYPIPPTPQYTTPAPQYPGLQPTLTTQPSKFQYHPPQPTPNPSLHSNTPPTYQQPPLNTPYIPPSPTPAPTYIQPSTTTTPYHPPSTPNPNPPQNPTYTTPIQLYQAPPAPPIYQNQPQPPAPQPYQAPIPGRMQQQQTPPVYNPYPAFAGPPPAPMNPGGAGSGSGLLDSLKSRFRK